MSYWMRAPFDGASVGLGAAVVLIVFEMRPTASCKLGMLRMRVSRRHHPLTLFVVSIFSAGSFGAYTPKRLEIHRECEMWAMLQHHSKNVAFADRLSFLSAGALTENRAFLVSSFCMAASVTTFALWQYYWASSSVLSVLCVLLFAVSMVFMFITAALSAKPRKSS